MDTAISILKKMGMPEAEPELSEWLKQKAVNLIVRCTACDMTMPVFGAYVSEKGETFCGGCANEP